MDAQPQEKMKKRAKAQAPGDGWWTERMTVVNESYLLLRRPIIVSILCIIYILY